MFPTELYHLKVAPAKAKSDGKVLSPQPLLLLAQWWLKDEVKTYVLKYTDRFYITFQAASHECALVERTSLLLQLHCKQSRLTRTPEEELFQERYNNWVSNLWPDFVFTPRFLIHFKTSMLQWHLKNNSLKWGTIIEHGTCELILFLPQIPNTLVCSGPGSKVEWASSFSDFTQIIWADSDFLRRWDLAQRWSGLIAFLILLR